MRLEDINTVAVLGAGTMGNGITQVVAMGGYDVVMRDIEDEYLEEGYERIEWSLGKLAENDSIEEDPEEVLSRIETEVDLATAVSDVDFVIEAVPEKIDLKGEVFEEVDELAPDRAVLASNTSSFSITDLAAATDRPRQVVGMHFFNPPVKLPLVEVVYGEETTDDTATLANDLVESMGMTSIYVKDEVPGTGFVVNYVSGPFTGEAEWMISEGEVAARELDAAMVHQRGYPMGPFELKDSTGIDVSYDVRKGADEPVAPILGEKVEANELGRKTGKGFYDYEDGEGVNYREGDGEGVDTLRIEAMMVNRAADLIQRGITTAEDIDQGVQIGVGYPEGMCERGDKLGLDTVLEKVRELEERFGDSHGEDRYEPTEYLVELVEAGKTGVDAGEGFYEY